MIDNVILLVSTIIIKVVFALRDLYRFFQIQGFAMANTLRIVAGQGLMSWAITHVVLNATRLDRGQDLDWRHASGTIVLFCANVLRLRRKSRVLKRQLHEALGGSPNVSMLTTRRQAPRADDPEAFFAAAHLGPHRRGRHYRRQG